MRWLEVDERFIKVLVLCFVVYWIKWQNKETMKKKDKKHSFIWQITSRREAPMLLILFQSPLRTEEWREVDFVREIEDEDSHLLLLCMAKVTRDQLSEISKTRRRFYAVNIRWKPDNHLLLLLLHQNTSSPPLFLTFSPTPPTPQGNLCFCFSEEKRPFISRVHRSPHMWSLVSDMKRISDSY